ncbi:transmembrane protein, putative [Medicago truncatula]|uniref:Transmembrane protein, putative n=1 Tax=Medicago truncatula TaxID=3880 RepID=G7ISJ4_MEDTR|nr:transmembrane protein, putative [Medicago truncatula]
MAGYLILMKCVMSSLPVYLVFFFKTHADIISYIKSIFNCFLWGGGGVVVLRTIGK